MLTPIWKSLTEPLSGDFVTKNDATWVDFGYVLKAHGVIGDVRIISLADIPLPPDLKEFRLVPRSGPPRTLSPTRLRPVHGAYLVAFEEVSGRDAARELKGAMVQIRRSVLPLLGEGEYYLFELKGAKVVGEDGASVGKVVDIFDNAGQVLLGLDYEGKERLLPLVDSWLRGYFRSSHELKVVTPPGLWES